MRYIKNIGVVHSAETFSQDRGDYVKDTSWYGAFFDCLFEKRAYETLPADHAARTRPTSFPRQYDYDGFLEDTPENRMAL